jgi:hypothetical protein
MMFWCISAIILVVLGLACIAHQKQEFKWNFRIMGASLIVTSGFFWTTLFMKSTPHINYAGTVISTVQWMCLIFGVLLLTFSAVYLASRHAQQFPPADTQPRDNADAHERRHDRQHN